MSSIKITEKDYKNYSLESTLCDYIRTRLTALGAQVVKIHGDAFQSAAVDFLICYKGYFLALEAKVGKNKPTARQLRFMEEVQEAGGHTKTVWTVADALVALQEIEDFHAAKPTGGSDTESDLFSS